MTIRVLFTGWMISLAVLAQGQKSRVLSVLQMIESEKYKEAKTAMDQIIENPASTEWSRTYYTKGLLCQKAFETGLDKNNDELTTLYPDQLILAYISYEKALDLKAGQRIRSAISAHYYALANDLKLQGRKQFQRREYGKALESFEHALLVSNSPLVEISLDTNLVYNTAMAAFESKNWGKAISYLTGLNDDSFSPRTALLLYKAQINAGDTLEAEGVLADAVERYHADEEIVLQLVDRLAERDRLDEAVQYLDRAISLHPANFNFYWTRGLLNEKTGHYEEAISDLSRASEIAPDQAGIHYSLGICYYNMGVAITEDSRSITNQQQYTEAREEAGRQFRLAIEQLEKARKLDPGHADARTKLSQLYQYLHM